MDIVAAPGSRGVGARRGVPLFCDVTVVCPLSRMGEARPQTARSDGHVVQAAQDRKHRHYADVDASNAGALIVLGCEVYGRWCTDALNLVKELAYLKARSSPAYLRASVRAAWFNRWWSLASVSTQAAIAEALLTGIGVDLLPAAVTNEGPDVIDLLELHQ